MRSMGTFARSRRPVCGLILAVAVTAAAFNAPGAAAADLASAQEGAKRAAEEVTRLERRVAELEEEGRRLDRRIHRIDRELRSVTARKDAAVDAYGEAEALYVASAIEAYKLNDHTQMALLLNASTLDDMYQVAEATRRIAAEASGNVEGLIAARAQLNKAESELEEKRDELLAGKERVEEIADEVRTALRGRRQVLAGFRKDIKRLEREARRAAAAAAVRSNIPVGDALLAILQGSGPAQGIPPGFVGTGVKLEGIASWYGPGFEGNTTAAGDIFDPNLYTVASKELPLRSWLYVEHEGRGVVVYVNDRGPYVGDRILDLSKAAAEAIGISGIGWVKAEVILKVDR